MTSFKPKFMSTDLKKTLLLTALLMITLNSVRSQTVAEFNDNGGTKRFAIANTSPRIVLDLDYPEAFEVTIKSFNGQEGNQGFCHTYPSQIINNADYTAGIPMATGLESYDTIAYYGGFYFLLDSLSLSVIATQDLTKPTSWITIKSSFTNSADSKGQYEEPNLAIDTDSGFMYIVLSENVYTYSLKNFITAYKAGGEIPKIKDKSANYKGYESVSGARYHQGHLYIIADNIAQVWQLNSEGVLKAGTSFDTAFFESTDLSISDLAFRDNYIFVLDKMNGVYTVKISNTTSNGTDQPEFTQTFEFLPSVGISSVTKCQFIDVIGDALTIVSGTGKNPYMLEYIIKGGAEITNFEFNRKTPLNQGARDTFTDGNFLYIITGFFNIVVKHSIPGRYHSDSVNEYLSNYWPLYGAKGIISTKKGTTNQIIALQDSYITIYTFEEDEPVLSCEVQGQKEGLYTYKIKMVKKDCPAKQKNPAMVSFQTICSMDATIELLVTEQGSEIGDTASTEKVVGYLVIATGVIALIFVIILCICRKYKNQYNVMEQKIKFHKLEQGNSEHDIGSSSSKSGKARSENELNPQQINIQVELQKAEARDNQKNPSPKKPAAEFGDIKPLDIDEIYGKGSKNDSF